MTRTTTSGAATTMSDQSRDPLLAELLEGRRELERHRAAIKGLQAEIARPTQAVEAFILWARTNSIRLREVSISTTPEMVGEVRVVLDDLAIALPKVKPDKGDVLESQSIHAAWAETLGVKYNETDDEEDG